MSFGKLRIASKLNPAWKLIAKRLTSKCEQCGQTILESVFDAFITGINPNCKGCSTAYWLTKPLIKQVFRITNLEEEDLKKLLSDQLVRKSMANVVRGIAHFGLKLPQSTAVPVVIVWNFTNRCNFHCIHCHQNSGDVNEKELNTEEAFAVIDKLGEAGISILTLSGGEPLVRKDVFDVLKHIDYSGILCTIASNGTLMTKEVVRKLKDSGVKRVEIGLDGCNAKTHDFLRNFPGSFEATIRGIKNCVKEGFDEVCTTMTLHSKNIKELQDTVELAEKLGVTRFYLNRLIPAGRGKDVINLDVTNDEKIIALECIYKKFCNSVSAGTGIQCYSRGMTYYGRLGFERSDGQVFTVSEALSGYSRMWKDKFGNNISEIVKKFAAGFGGCSAGITYAGMTASGDLLPCVPAPIKLGNLLEDNLEDIWVNNPLLNYIRRRDKLKGACGECNYNRICGGCRYTAYAINGDWLEADPSCPFGPSDNSVIVDTW